MESITYQFYHYHLEMDESFQTAHELALFELKHQFFHHEYKFLNYTYIQVLILEIGE